MANNDYTAELDEIKATIVPENARMSVLPKYLGARYMMVGEGAVYSWMGALSPEYDGGLWDYYELSNGSFFMAPSGVEKLTIEARGNGYTGTMSAEAAGITACLYAFAQIANQTAQAHFIDLYQNLRAYAVRHFECSEILAAID